MLYYICIYSIYILYIDIDIYSIYCYMYFLIYLYWIHIYSILLYNGPMDSIYIYLVIIVMWRIHGSYKLANVYYILHIQNRTWHIHTMLLPLLPRCRTTGGASPFPAWWNVTTSIATRRSHANKRGFTQRRTVTWAAHFWFITTLLDSKGGFRCSSILHIQFKAYAMAAQVGRWRPSRMTGDGRPFTWTGWQSIDDTQDWARSGL